MRFHRCEVSGTCPREAQAALLISRYPYYTDVPLIQMHQMLALLAARLLVKQMFAVLAARLLLGGRYCSRKLRVVVSVYVIHSIHLLVGRQGM